MPKKHGNYAARCSDARPLLHSLAAGSGRALPPDAGSCDRPKSSPPPRRCRTPVQIPQTRRPTIASRSASVGISPKPAIAFFPFMSGSRCGRTQYIIASVHATPRVCTVMRTKCDCNAAFFRAVLLCHLYHKTSPVRRRL